MPFEIYKVSNKVNKKLYIGVSTISMKWRWEEHKKNARKGVKKVLYDDMRLHGEDMFDAELLETCNDPWTMYQREMELIREMGTLYPNGYNLPPGRQKRG